ncbi:MAG: hypothetical protein A2Z66_09365 [Chloroflexi bacterium RBG_13_66_10]|nr:MAG: hypothetical protein A2Z66_09365 [Chloroflexi bacterium RBG_13_66_10]
MLVGLLAATAAAAIPPDFSKFVAPLSGRNEVPARETNARGVALFTLDEGAGELTYMLIVANIENVVASHIHCGLAGVNAPVGVTLFIGPAGTGRLDGILAQGTAMAPDSGNGCDWATLGDVAAAIMAGRAYVNVHTNDGVAPANTGPGDFPGGEIRGQIRVAGPR